MMGKKGKKGGRIEQIEKELRQLKEERRTVVERVERGEECANEMKKIKNKIDRKRKARRGCVLRAKINELEMCYQKRDTRRYWNQLKEVGGWCRKGGGRIPDTVVDEKGEEQTGQDVLRVGGIHSSIWGMRISMTKTLTTSLHRT